MAWIDLIGYVAGFLVIISLLPQIIKSWKTKSTKDLSLSRYVIYVVGVALWLVYGLLLPNGPMIAINSVNLVFASSILYLKLRYG